MPSPSWVTSGGSIGNYVDGIAMSYTLVATPSNPSNGVYYTLNSGNLPVGIILDTDTGILSGTPASVSEDAQTTFVITATEFNGSTIIGTSDRTFSITIVNNPPSWTTPVGNIGSFNQLESLTYTFTATPAGTGNTIKYSLINGSFPVGAGSDFTLNTNTGELTGTPARVIRSTTSTFTLRATEYSGTTLAGTSDRVFTITIVIPQPIWITSAGSIGSYPENTPINYNFSANTGSAGDTIRYVLLNGSLPETGDINSPMRLSSNGLLYGTPTEVSSNTTSEFTIRAQEYSGSSPISFNDRTFSITIIGPDAPTFTTTGPWTYDDSVWVSIPLLYTNPDPNTTITITLQSGDLPPGIELASSGLLQGYPDIPLSSSITYNFTLRISNGTLYSDQAFAFTVNLNTGDRSPTIYNTQPPQLDMTNTEYAPYYFTAPSMGTYQQGTNFVFKIIGHDFDDQELTYAIGGLDDLGLNPGDVSVNTATGWIYGTLRDDIGASSNTFPITAEVYRTSDPLVISGVFNYTITILGTVNTGIVWISDTNLGQIFNGGISTLRVLAVSPNSELEYSLISGSLPDNLVLNTSGEIYGRVPFESTSSKQSLNQQVVYTFTVQATNVLYPAITSTKTFTITTVQRNMLPYDNIYIRAYPGQEQQTLYNDLITNTLLIPDEAIYRPDDIYFGRRTDIVYNHMYGIPSSTTFDYVNAVIKNHYRRNITLGELRTARATDDFGVTIYEVVYSLVIDDLVNNINQSISKQITWPRPITLPDSSIVNTLYPNSLPNMRTQVANSLGLINDPTLLPRWMYSQQIDGNSLGYVQAVVLCYTKPGWAQQIVNNINDIWQYQLNIINFELDRFEVDRSISYQYNSEIALWNPYYDSANNSFVEVIPSSVSSDESEDTYVYFSRNILTEAANQDPPILGLPIVLVFNTDLGSGTTVTIPLKGIVDVVVAWGDGNISSYNTAGNYAHTYSAPGAYTVTISGSLTGYGSSIADNTMLAAVVSWGDTGLTDTSYAFYNATNLVLVPTTIPSSVTDSSYMFAGASSINSDISLWNTRSITNMESMFDGATAFNNNIEAWDVSSVTNMTAMFNAATAFNQNLSNWCVTNIPVEPANFSTGSALTVGNIPVWGTCPNNQA